MLESLPAEDRLKILKKTENQSCMMVNRNINAVTLIWDTFIVNIQYNKERRKLIDGEKKVDEAA